VLDVKEPIGQVVRMLQAGSHGTCRECYAELPRVWETLCSDCRQHRHNGVEHDPEEALT
jgi:hypothetical protein